MKLIRKIPVIEIKRCFVMAQLVRKLNNHKKAYLGAIGKSEFAERLTLAKIRLATMTEVDLDRFIFNDSHKSWRRVNAYNDAEWYVGEVSVDEVGVWRRAGEMPLAWTNGTLAGTAKCVKNAIDERSKVFAKRAAGVANMLRIDIGDTTQKEKYLLPIIFEGGTGTRGRKYLKQKMKGDIDDGNMRAITLAIAGKKHIRAYIGMRVTE